MIREAYGWFGLEPRYTFATRPDGAIGDPALWDRAEGYIKAALEAAGVPYRVKPKDGTFYAPKIDIYIDDALGREWQMATIQADLTMLPERFDLTYIDEQGKPQRPIAIHRAIYGSLERFIGILVEHFGGAFPLWVAPVQAVVIPIADRHVEAARELAGVLRARGLGSRWTTLEPDAEQDPDRPRSRRCRTWSSSATARSRPARRRRGRGAGEQQPAEGWDELADRLAAEVARAPGLLSLRPHIRPATTCGRRDLGGNGPRVTLTSAVERHPGLARTPP